MSPHYDEYGMRLTDCCGAHSTWIEGVLSCKVCYDEVPLGQGDGGEHALHPAVKAIDDLLYEYGDALKPSAYVKLQDIRRQVHASMTTVSLAAQTFGSAYWDGGKDDEEGFAGSLLHELRSAAGLKPECLLCRDQGHPHGGPECPACGRG